MPWLVGYPREKVNWHPAIDSSKCVRCGMCMNCGKQVFEWTEEVPVVARPDKCVVGCSTCATLCRGQCITFPDPEELRRLYREHRIWDGVRGALEREGVLPPSDSDEACANGPKGGQQDAGCASRRDKKR